MSQHHQPPVHALYQGIGTQVVIPAWNGDRAFLASDHYSDSGTQQYGYDIYRVPKEVKGLCIVSTYPSYFVPYEHISVPCRYVDVCNAAGTVMCPSCTHWYCPEHVTELFLDRVKLMGDIVHLPAPICPECHYTLYCRPHLEK